MGVNWKSISRVCSEKGGMHFLLVFRTFQPLIKLFTFQIAKYTSLCHPQKLDAWEKLIRVSSHLESCS